MTRTAIVYDVTSAGSTEGPLDAHDACDRYDEDRKRGMPVMVSEHDGGAVVCAANGFTARIDEDAREKWHAALLQPRT